MANKLILIRHPDKVGDAEGIYLGNRAGITAKGQEQIPLVIARLKLLLPDAVICSMYPRAVALAERISEELHIPEPIQSDLFNEIDKPQFLIGMHRDDPVHQEVMQAIRDQFDDDSVPTELLRGEKIRTRSEIEEEIRKLFLYVEHFRTDSPILPNTLLAVTHAKKIAALLHYVYNRGSLKGYYQTSDRAIKISTTGVSILTLEPDRRTHEMAWHIRTVNEEVHMDIGYDEEMRKLLRTL